MQVSAASVCVQVKPRGYPETLPPQVAKLAGGHSVSYDSLLYQWQLSHWDRQAQAPTLDDFTVTDRRKAVREVRSCVILISETFPALCYAVAEVVELLLSSEQVLQSLRPVYQAIFDSASNCQALDTQVSV